MATPPRPSYFIPPIPNLPSPSGSRPRGSISSSFSFDPSHLVHSYLDANASRRGSAALDPNRSILTASPLLSSPRRTRKARPPGQAGEHPLAQDTTQDVFLDDDEYYGGMVEDRSDWSMVERMRLWRHDAIWQHLYETAAFWGDKVLSWTNDRNDAFWLAQIYFLMHQYSRAERLLTRPFPNTPTETLQQAANGHNFPVPTSLHDVDPKGKGKDTGEPPRRKFAHLDLAIPGIDIDPGRLPMGLGAEDLAAEQSDGVTMLVDTSVACRYLAAQCQVRQGKWAEAAEMLGESNPFRDTGGSGPRIANTDGGIKIEASMCHLRGMLKLKLNRGDSAKECFMEALALDVKCYEAFNQLISGEMMTSDEEWEFVQSLAYKQQTPHDAEFIQLMYTSRLRKYKHAREHELIRRRLVDEFGLKDNVDVLFSFADAAYAQFRWADCFVITSRILALVDVHEHTMPLHIACMHHLPHLHSKLFILAHEMVEKEPEAAMSWYAVGVWYLTSKKWAEARTYFSKTSLMDPRFAPAWIAFAHTFAFEGEHDHAVTAYSTCARLFTGSHLPLMFVGMEQIMLSNHDLADEALNAAFTMCDGDPLLYNELGVMAFNRGKYDQATTLFMRALELAEISQSSQGSWATTYVNMGSALSKLGQFDKAQAAYKRVLEIDPRHATALALLGKVHFMMGDTESAILRYHESLSVDPINGHVVDMLNLALEANTAKPMPANTPSVSDPQFLAGMQRSRELVKKLDSLKGPQLPPPPTGMNWVPPRAPRAAEEMNLG